MIFSHPAMSSVIEIGAANVETLVIENRNFFYELVSDIQEQINGNDGQTTLYDGVKILELAKYAEIIDSYIGFSLNRKTLLTKITSELERKAMSESVYLETHDLLMKTSNYLEELFSDFSCNLEYEKLSIGSILKAVGIHICEDYAEPLEKIIDYMELVREFDRDRLFIFINLRSYFSAEKLELFFETVLSHEYKILLIDGFADKILRNEHRLIIDEDLCEI